MGDVREVSVGGQIIGGKSLALIAGPCVLEEPDINFRIAEDLKAMAGRLGIPYIFKASYDKANRTSVASARGPGLERGLEMLAEIKQRFDVPVISDIHETTHVKPASPVLDMLQIPAFLSRQTDLLVAAGESGLPVNVKKGQFLAPQDMEHVAGKVKSTGNEQILLTERGASFGYHNLVVDMRGLVIMRGLGYPVVFDATHSVQLPGGGGGKSSGERQFVAPLSRAAVAAGVDAIFAEVHPCPDEASCDGPNMLALDEVESLMQTLLEVRTACQT